MGIQRNFFLDMKVGIEIALYRGVIKNCRRKERKNE